MTKRTGKRKTKALPAAACDEVLYQRLYDYAEDKELSMSEVIRDAVEIFLRGKSRKSNQKRSISESKVSSNE